MYFGRFWLFKEPGKLCSFAKALMIPITINGTLHPGEVFLIFFFFFWSFLGPNLRHMEVPRLRVELEL